MQNFTHLHVHTQYSILDGAADIALLMQKAQNNEMTALAITDHGNMFGCKYFYDQACKFGIKPIIGCEMYVAEKRRFDKTEKEDRSGYHLIVLAKNLTGYHNLIKLVSQAWIDGFYYKPRIDKELLKEYKEGLIIMTACLAGEIPDTILSKNLEKAENLILEFKEWFGEDFYLEIQRHRTGNMQIDSDTFAKQEIVSKALIDFSRKLNVKLIASNDVHFLNKEDGDAHDILICLNTGKDFNDPKRMRYTKEEYLKTKEEMYDLFADIPEACENTMEIAAKVEPYALNINPMLPDFPIPEGYTDENQYLEHITYEGAKVRYSEITPEIKTRIDYELSVVKTMGFAGYFLIVQDFLSMARSMGISVGPGRGSAAGSVVAFCIRITDIDPLKYNLLFERFLNPERISMPDIDIDFDEDGRDKIIEWVVEKYGKNRVAQIVTFGSMAAKMAIRDVARVLNLSLPDAIRLSKLIPEKPNTTIKKAYEDVKELRDERNSTNKLIAETLKFAEELEGSVRQTGLHACGVIISKDDLINHIPICTSKDTNLYVTQYEGSLVESVGMLKMDFLGLKTLSIVKDAVDNIKLSRGIEIDIEKIPFDDELTFELFSNGNTIGTFQFESEGMRKHLRDLKPNRFEDLIAMNALYRPGPMQYIPSYINRKHGREKIEYDFPIMEEFLKETYGITVYQEQVMLLSQAMADFTGGAADSLRKAMGKKKRKDMDALKEKFQEGCNRKDMDPEKVQKVWEDWEKFSEYAFNKSHATSYSYLAFQTAYLKAHYPAEYMSAVLSRNLNDIKKITSLIDECKRMDLLPLGPDVNESHLKFFVNKDGNLRFGLAAIKGVGEAAALNIIEEREKNGNYKSIFDFVERVNLHSVGKKSIEALALAGGFDLFMEVRRHQFFAEAGNEPSFIESLLKYGNKMQAEKNTNQQSLFGGASTISVKKPVIPECEEWSSLHRLNKEKEVIGIFLSAHPLDPFSFDMKYLCDVNLGELVDLAPYKDKEITIAGMVTSNSQKISKAGKPYYAVTIEDFFDSYKFTLFGNDVKEFGGLIFEGNALIIKAKIQESSYRKDELDFRIQSIDLLSNVRDKMFKSIVLKININHLTHEMIEDILSLIDKNKGNTMVKFYIYCPDENIFVDLFSRKKSVHLSDEFIDYLNNTENITYKIN